MPEEKKSAKGWPIGIAVFYASFVLFLLAALFLTAMDQDDLVTKDYYAAEQRYQEQIYRQQRTRSLHEKPRLFFSDNEQLLTLSFPEEFPASSVSGTITFFRPSEADLDHTIAIELDDSGVQLIETAQLQKGRWKVKMLWQARGLEYYQEEVIVVR